LASSLLLGETSECCARFVFPIVPAIMPEKRVDPHDGIAYTWQEFEHYYRLQNNKAWVIKAHWEKMKMAASVTRKKRIDPFDGKAYSWDEFFAYYVEDFKQHELEAMWAKMKPGQAGMAKGRMAEDPSPPYDLATDLRSRTAQAHETFSALPHDGKTIWKALVESIDSSIQLGEVHFERALREELETLLGDVQLQRQAGSQWTVTVGRSTFYASVRSEVVGFGDDATNLLAELKQAARRVRSTLLSDGASWLRELCNVQGDGQRFTAVREEFLEHCHDVMDNGGKGSGGGHGFNNPDGGPVCHVCGKPLSTDLLGGRHHCRVVAQFRCCGKWTSQRARYDPVEERVMGQRCERCRQFGAIVTWQVYDDASHSYDERQPHRSHLCEACDRYGNCGGAFFDPFMMSMAIRMYTGLAEVQWQRHRGEDLWSAEVNGSNVVLQPHVFASRHAWEG